MSTNTVFGFGLENIDNDENETYIADDPTLLDQGADDVEQSMMGSDEVEALESFDNLDQEARLASLESLIHLKEELRATQGINYQMAVECIKQVPDFPVQNPGFFPKDIPSTNFYSIGLESVVSAVWEKIQAAWEWVKDRFKKIFSSDTVEEKEKKVEEAVKEIEETVEEAKEAEGGDAQGKYRKILENMPEDKKDQLKAHLKAVAAYNKGSKSLHEAIIDQRKKSNEKLKEAIDECNTMERLAKGNQQDVENAAKQVMANRKEGDDSPPEVEEILEQLSKDMKRRDHDNMSDDEAVSILANTVNTLNNIKESLAESKAAIAAQKAWGSLASKMEGIKLQQPGEVAEGVEKAIKEGISSISNTLKSAGVTDRVTKANIGIKNLAIGCLAKCGIIGKKKGSDENKDSSDGENKSSNESFDAFTLFDSRMNQLTGDTGLESIDHKEDRKDNPEAIKKQLRSIFLS